MQQVSEKSVLLVVEKFWHLALEFHTFLHLGVFLGRSLEDLHVALHGLWDDGLNEAEK